MSAEHNAARIRGAYEAFTRGDVAALVDVFDQDIVWHYPGNNPLSGDHKGRDAVLGFLGQFGERTGGNYQAHVREVMASDDHAAGWANDVASRNGKALDVNAVVVFHMSGGRVLEAWHYFDDQAALDAFWS